MVFITICGHFQPISLWQYYDHLTAHFTSHCGHLRAHCTLGHTHSDCLRAHFIVVAHTLCLPKSPLHFRAHTQWLPKSPLQWALEVQVAYALWDPINNPFTFNNPYDAVFKSLALSNGPQSPVVAQCRTISGLSNSLHGRYHTLVLSVCSHHTSAYGHCVITNPNADKLMSGMHA